MKTLKADWSKCAGVEATARNNNKDAPQCLIMNHIETKTLNSHKISKYCYHSCDLQGNDVRILMSRGIVVFDKIK